MTPFTKGRSESDLVLYCGRETRLDRSTLPCFASALAAIADALD